MKIDSLFDEKAVSTTLGYILVVSIGVTFFSMLMLSLNSIFYDTPKAIVTESVYNDIGNGISTKMVDIYIIAPMNGSIDTKFDIPINIANERYKIEIGSSKDQEIIVSSLDSSNNVAISINGIGHSMDTVTGEIYSGTTEHEIRLACNNLTVV